MQSNTDTAAAPPLGQRPNEPAPGKDSLHDPFGRKMEDDGKGSCPDCGLPFSDHPTDFSGHATPVHASMNLPGAELQPRELGGDPAEQA